MPRYKITVEYIGTDLCGWQRQDDGLSVQQILEEALFKLTGEKQKVTASGRTDAGVHAIGQVCHFDLEREDFHNKNISHGLNFHLIGSPVSISHAEKVADDFHARFGAQRRHYQYVILNRNTRSVIHHNRVWVVPNKLDENKMQEAAKYFLGKHDYTSFRARECQAKSPIKTVDTLTVRRDGEFIYIDISAKSFLHNMVRNIAGTLKEVGEDKISPSDIEGIFAAKDRSKAGARAPASGLFFMKTDY